MAEREHEDGVECWCGPQILATAEGRVTIHYGPNGTLPPATLVAQACLELYNETHYAATIEHQERS
jgi:hypothetical protein